MKNLCYPAQIFLTAVFLLIFWGIGRSQTFTDINANLDGASGATAVGAAAWGDYDNDGDLDLAYTGAGANNTKVTRLYRNDDGTFVSVNAGLPDVSNGGLAWGDYDNDGDLDFFLMGFDAQFVSVSDVFRNDNGSFSALGLNLPRVDATVSWVDFDNDGDLDLLLAGFGLGTNSPLLYRNDGDDMFTEIVTGLPEINGSEGAWGDYDNDGDLDLVIVGFESGAGPVSKIFRNDGDAGANAWTFTDMSAGLTGVREGSAAWGDFDSDGDLDLAITGRAANENISQIYRNNGNSTFTAIGAGLEGVRFGDCAWGDYDNDGDLDLVITGRTNTFDNIVRIYENDQGTFNDSNIPIGGVSSSTLAWGDFDFDGDLDLFVMGASEGGAVGARIFRNNSSTANNTPATPTNLLSGINGTALTLVWDRASDPQTPAPGLTYNIRLGTTPGGSEVVAPMSLSSGRHKLAQMGNVQQNRLWTIENIDTTKTYYWTVQSVDNSFLGSAFAPEQIVQPKLITDTSFVEMDFDLQDLAASDAEWGDFDGDGDLDFAVTGGAGNQGFTFVYRNDNIGGVRSFPQVGGNLLAVLGGALKWGDFDNDNDLDLLVTGENNSLQPRTGLFRNDDGTFVEIAATIPNVTASDADWADIDHDGDIDLLLTGSSEAGTPMSRIYENRNRAGTFVDSDAGLTGLASGAGLLFDYNNDQSLEILVTGQTEDGFRFTGLYQINANGDYQNFNPSIPGLWLSAVDVGDYDNDGDLDFAVSGARSDEDPTPQDAQPFTFIYRNDISTGGGINQVDADLKQLYRCALDWGDYDADGDLDLLITGFDGTQYHTRIYRNDGNDDFQQVDPQLEAVINGAVEWGDYNNDGRLDILMTGQTSTTLPVTKIYQNIRQESNNTPSPPTSGFSSNVQGNQVTLSWGAGSDPQTPADGLTYNLRAGTTSGGNDVVSSPTTASGLNKLARRGNTEQNRQWTIENPPAGETIYWSVQAVDNHFAASAFSAEMSFEISNEFLFSDTQIQIPGIHDGDAEWGDYNADGDLDFIILGNNDGQRFTGVYRNDGGSFTDIGSALPDLLQAAAAWGDFDNDGDLDLALTGLAGITPDDRLTKIYKNNDASFDEFLSLPPVFDGDIVWSDLDRDGDLDLIVAGTVEPPQATTPGTGITQVFRNEVGQYFIHTVSRVDGVERTSLPNLWSASFSVTDYNQDSKPDIFLTGLDPAFNSGALVYTNQEYKRRRYYSFAPAIELMNLSSVSSAWGDYDNDGYPDLLYNGIGTFSVPSTYLYHNDNGQGFTLVDAGLPAIGNGDVAWGDLDNDGDLDMVICGSDADNNPSTVMLENVNGTFREAPVTIVGVTDGSLALADYDNDNDLDLLILGHDGTQSVTRLYRNDSGLSNSPPTAPTGLTSTLDEDIVTLSWNPAFDNATAQSTLTYNISMGTSVSPIEVTAPHARQDGTRLLAAPGNVGSKTSVSFRIDTLTAHHWRVQAVDNAFVASQFSEEQTFAKPDSLSFFNVWPDMEMSDIGGIFQHWIDYDNDGDLDLITDGNLTLFRNDGEGGFVPSGQLTPVGGTPIWADFDNNGSVDVLVNSNPPRTYLNNDGVFVEGAHFPQGRGDKSIVDIDNDGWMDVVWAGGDPSVLPFVDVYRNNRDGTFELLNTGLPGLPDSRRVFSGLKWADYDKDGDIDVLYAGGVAENIPGVFRNDGNLSFTAQPLIPSRNYTSRWIDYDNDGDLDVISWTDDILALFENRLVPTGSADIELLFTTENPFYLGVPLEKFVDSDNDGAVELWSFDRHFRFRDDGTFEETVLFPQDKIFVVPAWIDYDGDGDLDRSYAFADSLDAIYRLYRNDGARPNSSPDAPDGLSAIVNGNFVTLSWNAATDDHSPQAALSYNLRVGTTPGGVDVVSPLALADGTRKVLEIGNANLSRSWIYELEPNTTYYWSVQALDQSNTGGPFAPEQTFTTGSQSTLVRFVNASGDPDLNNLDIYVGGSNGNLTNKVTVSALASAETLLQDDLGYLQGSALLPLPADSALSLAIAPGNSTDSDDAVASFDGVQFAAGQTAVVSIFGVGEPAQFAPNPEGRETALALHPQDVTRDSVELTSNEVAIYFVHGVTDAPAVNVTIASSNTSPVQLGTFSYGESSEIIAMPAEETEILITAISGEVIVGSLQDFSPFARAVVPVLFSGFLDPGANQNGPVAAITNIAPNGDVITFIKDDDSVNIPEQFELFPNYPNPFNPSTTIRYSLPQASHVELTIFDVLGRKVATLLNREQRAGNHRVVFNASGLASGVFFYRLRAGHFAQTRKMLLLQ